jgi:hypothetical protein
MSTSSQIQQEIEAAKALFCEAFNGVYEKELTVNIEEGATLFYSVQQAPNPTKYPGVYTVQIQREHLASKYCLTKNRGFHINSSKLRSYTVSLRNHCVWQKCWTAECSAKKCKGRIALVENEDSESSSDDDVAQFQPVTNSNKKRKRTVV